MSGFAVRIQGDSRIVVMGEVDMATSPQIQSAIDSLNHAGASRVVLDLAGVSFMDSTGLAGLVHGRAMLESRGGILVLGALSTQVQVLLRTVGLESTFVHESPLG